MVKFELDKKGLINILKSDEVLQMCTTEANNRKGADERINPFVGFDRASCLIMQRNKNDRGNN